MAYGTKYKLCIESLRKRKYTCYLKKLDYEGMEYDVKGSNNPLSIMTPNRKRKFTPIAGQELKINLIHQPEETNFNLLKDFKDISNREWKAEVFEEVEGGDYQAKAGIISANIGASEIPASALFDNLYVPPAETDNLYTDLTFTVNGTSNLTAGAPLDMALYVFLSGNQSWESSNLYKVREVQVFKDDTANDIINRFVAADSRLTKIDENTIRYTVSQNPSGQEVLITGSSKMIGKDSSSYFIGTSTFTVSGYPSAFYSLDRHYLDFTFRIKTQGNVYTNVLLYRYLQVPGDTSEDIWTKVANGIGTTTINDIYLNDYPTELVSLRVRATKIIGGPGIKLDLLDIGEKGNGVPIQYDQAQVNGTYLEITTDGTGSFAPETFWPDQFTGAVEGGDIFTFEYTGAVSGQVEIRAQEGETIQSIIQRIVEALNVQESQFNAIVDPLSDKNFIVQTALDMSSGSYVFSHSSTAPPYVVHRSTVNTNISSASKVPFLRVDFPEATRRVKVDFDARRLGLLYVFLDGLSVTYRLGTTEIETQIIQVNPPDDFQSYSFPLSSFDDFDNIQINFNPAIIGGINLLAGDSIEVKNLVVGDESAPIQGTVISGESGFTYVTENVGEVIIFDEGPDWAIGGGSQLLFTGFVAPQLTDVPHIPSNIPIKISALCGLGELKNFNFEVNDRRPFEKLSLMTMLAICLQKTDLNLKIYEAFPYWFIDADYTQSALTQVYEDSSRWNGATIYAVLESVVNTAEAVIIQKNGHWELKPISLLKNSSIAFRVFTENGNYINTVTDSTHIKTVGSCTPRPFIGASGKKINKPAFRQLLISQDYGAVSQLVKFPNFSNIDTNITSTEYNPQYPWKWSNQGVVVTAYATRINREDDGLLRINDARQQPDVLDLRQTILLGDFGDGFIPKERNYRLSVQYEANPNLTSVPAEYMELTFRVPTSSGGYAYLYEEDPDNPVDNPFRYNATTETEKRIRINTFDEEGPTIRTFEQTFDFPVLALNQVVEAELILHQPSADIGYIRIKSVKIEVNANLENVRNTAEYFIDQDSAGIPWNKRVTSIVENIKVAVSDVPKIAAGAQVYKNALFAFDGDIPFTTQFWSPNPEDAEPTTDELIAFLRSTWMDEYAVPFGELNAAIEGVNIWEEIQDTTDGNLLYTCIGGEWNLRLDQVKGKWQQINLKLDNPSFPAQRVIEILPSEADSGGDNAYTGVGGGSVSPGGEIIVNAPVQSVNNKVGDVTLNTDDITSTNTNNYVNADGKILAEKGGRALEQAIAWDGSLFILNMTKERFYLLNVVEGTTEINFGFKFGVDNTDYSRRCRAIIYNNENTQNISTLNFTGLWSWFGGSPPEEILAGESYVLTVENISNQLCIAKFEILGAKIVPPQGIGIWVIEDTFIVQ